MKIACLSGKGGAGKTLVAVNLAAVAGSCTYIDCDVEEPNGHLFLKPQGVCTQPVTVAVPRFDPQKCTGCRACVDFCRFHALMYVGKTPRLFTEVCHSCGGCALVCPTGAITEQPRTIGRLEVGDSRSVRVVTGVLEPGEASGVPVIRRALAQARGLTFIDCPPGSACTVMESIADADLCLLVAEPTAFGLHDLQLVCRLVELLHRRCAVVINKQTEPYGPLEEFCAQRGLPILARLPYDPTVAALTAAGQPAAEGDESTRARFVQLLARLGGGL